MNPAFDIVKDVVLPCFELWNKDRQRMKNEKYKKEKQVFIDDFKAFIMQNVSSAPYVREYMDTLSNIVAHVEIKSDKEYTFDLVLEYGELHDLVFISVLASGSNTNAHVCSCAVIYDDDFKMVSRDDWPKYSLKETYAMIERMLAWMNGKGNFKTDYANVDVIKSNLPEKDKSTDSDFYKNTLRPLMENCPGFLVEHEMFRSPKSLGGMPQSMATCHKYVKQFYSNPYDDAAKASLLYRKLEILSFINTMRDTFNTQEK